MLILLSVMSPRPGFPNRSNLRSSLRCPIIHGTLVLHLGSLPSVHNVLPQPRIHPQRRSPRGNGRRRSHSVRSYDRVGISRSGGGIGGSASICHIGVFGRGGTSIGTVDGICTCRVGVQGTDIGPCYEYYETLPQFEWRIGLCCPGNYGSVWR